MVTLTTVIAIVAVAHVVVIAVAAYSRYNADKAAAARAELENYELKTARGHSEKGLLTILKTSMWLYI